MSTLIVLTSAAVVVLAVVATTSRNRRAVTDGPRSGWDVLVHELERARRHERPFVLARLTASAAHDSGSLPRRRIDEVWRIGDDLYVLLTETDLTGGRRWRERAMATAALGGLVAGDIRLATFPDDGLTTGALLATLDDSATDAPIPASEPVPERASEPRSQPLTDPPLGVEQQAS